MPESKHFNEHIKEAKQMYQKGASLEDVAKHFNVFRGTNLLA